MRNKGLTRLVYILFIIGLISFIIVPFSGDIEVFVGGSRLADHYGKGLIYSSFKTWDLKGVFLRLFTYIGYSLAGVFASCPSTAFSIILSSLYAVMIVAVSCLAAYNLAADKRDRLLFAAAFCTAFFVVDNWSKMQAEMTCSLLLVVSLILAMKKGKHGFLWLAASGAIISFLFWFKAPLLLLSMSFAAAFVLVSKDKLADTVKKITAAAASSVCFLLLVGVIVYLINPNEYSSILISRIYQNTLLSGNSFSIISVGKHFVRYYMQSMLSIPALYIGTACLAANFAGTIKNKEYVKGLCHFAMWLAPFLYVTISNCFFVYHYMTFMFPALIEIWIFLDGKRDGLCIRRRILTTVIIVGSCVFGAVVSYAAKPIVFHANGDIILGFAGVLLLLVFFIVCLRGKNKKTGAALMLLISCYSLTLFFAYSSVFSSNAVSYLKLKEQSYANDFTLPMEEDEKILYLDAGDGAYYFGYDTYFEEYYPLVLQRIDEGSEKSKLQRYVESSEKILSYDGNFICLTDEFIFPNGKNPTLKQKIETEYELYKTYDVYFTPMSIFNMQTEENMHQLVIYKRKSL